LQNGFLFVAVAVAVSIIQVVGSGKSSHGARHCGRRHSSHGQIQLAECVAKDSAQHHDWEFITPRIWSFLFLGLVRVQHGNAADIGCGGGSVLRYGNHHRDDNDKHKQADDEGAK
jgi:hypothetical protein